MTLAAPWLNRVPKSWGTRPLAFLVRAISGATPPKEDLTLWGGTLPWVSPKDMKIPVIADSEDHVTERALSVSALRLVKPPAVLVVVRGMILIRTVPVALTTVPVTLNQDMKALLPSAAVNPGFLAHALRAFNSALLSLVEEAGHGTKKLRTDLWRRFLLPVPPLATQFAISSWIDRKTAAIDNLIQKKERLMTLLEEKRQALITQRVTVPSDGTSAWRRTRLGWVLREAHRPVAVEPDRSYAEIGIRSHGRGVFHKEAVFGRQLEEKKVFWVEPGDLVFNIVFAWERAVAVVSEAERGRIASHRFPTYRPIQNLCDVRFLRFLFISDFGRFLLDQNSPGAAGRNRTLDRRALMKEEVPLPSVEEQVRLADLLEREIPRIDAGVSALEKQLDFLLEYRQAIITAAVTGQLDIPAEAA